MAFINKGRKEIARDIPTASIRDVPDTADKAGGVRFEMQIGQHLVSLTEWERDVIVSTWSKLSKMKRDA